MTCDIKIKLRFMNSLFFLGYSSLSTQRYPFNFLLRNDGFYILMTKLPSHYFPNGLPRPDSQEARAIFQSKSLVLEFTSLLPPSLFELMLVLFVELLEPADRKNVGRVLPLESP